MLGSPPTRRCCSSSGRWKAFTGALSRNSTTQLANHWAHPMAYMAPSPSACAGHAGRVERLGPAARSASRHSISTSTGCSFARSRNVWRTRICEVLGLMRSQFPALLLLAGDDLEAAVSSSAQLAVLEVPGAARDLLARREVLALGREAQVVDRAPVALDAVAEPRVHDAHRRSSCPGCRGPSSHRRALPGIADVAAPGSRRRSGCPPAVAGSGTGAPRRDRRSTSRGHPAE